MKTILMFLFLFINSGIAFAADGKINGNDVKKLNASLLKRSGEIGYDTSADIYPPGSPDGIVDIRDMQLLQRSFGSQTGQGKYNLNADIYHSKPTAVTLSVSDSSSNSVTLNWSVSNDTDFLQYKIYYDTNAGVDTGSTLSEIKTNRYDTGYIVSGLSPSTQYYFRVYVSDTGGNLAASDIVSCTTLGGAVIYGVAMVTVNTGTFNMGLAGVAEPVHSVTLTRQYEIGKYEVTNKQYCDMLQYAYNNGWIQANADSAWITRNGGDTMLIELRGLYNWNTGAGTEQCRINFGGGIFTVDPGYDSHPVIYVTWFGSALYCNFLSLYEGRQICYDSTTWQYDTTASGYHLPTEAQWEFAAVGNSGNEYPWTGAWDQNKCANIYNRYNVNLGTNIIGSYPTGASVFSGIHDMAGNVWEWCNDWYAAYSGAEVDPIGANSGSNRVYRGGAWNFNEGNCRSAYRNNGTPSIRSCPSGFRLARTLPPPPEAVVLNTCAAATMPSIAVDSTTVKISWSQSGAGNFASYKIYYSQTPGVSLSSTLGATITTVDSLKITISGLTADTIYYFRVYVFDNGGLSVGSNEIAIRTDYQSVSGILMRKVEPIGGNPHGIEYNYYIGKYEVTNEEYALVLNWAKNQGKIAGGTENNYAQAGTITDRISWNGGLTRYEVTATFEKHPVTNVSYNDIGVWLNWLSEMEGLTPAFAGVSADPSGGFDTSVNGYRLPENGEWTYATIGPNVENDANTSADWYYPWVQPDGTLTMRFNSSTYAHPWTVTPRTTLVGFFNGYTNIREDWGWTAGPDTFATLANLSYIGALDMAGNVIEWTTEINTTSRAYRGGSWASAATNCRSAYRSYSTPSVRSNIVGFRFARTY